MPDSTKQYPYITVTQGLSGYFAVMVVNIEGFEEPECTGVGRYALQADAIKEGQDWAAAEELSFVMPTIATEPARQDVVEQLKELVPGIRIMTVEEFIADCEQAGQDAVKHIIKNN